MSGIIYQYQQAYMPANGNTFHFWVDCSKEIYEEEAAEGGTVRLLYSEPAVSLAELVFPVDGLPDNAEESQEYRTGFAMGCACYAKRIVELNPSLVRKIEEAG